MADAVEKIEQFQRFGSILGLERMNLLLDKLGNPQEDLKVIHVAGTNGKGSICRYIYSMLRANGYSVGLFTSPFIEVFNERIELDDEYISHEDLEHYTKIVLEKTKELVKEGHQSPTEFEVITAIMFLYFKEKNPDYVILEVGLGGRGDSTNVITKPLITVIASISFDHTDRLGDTLAKIAYEKAGIIKKGCPVVTSCNSKEALDVIDAIAEENETYVIKTKDTRYDLHSQELSGYTFGSLILGKRYENISISMLGKHQIENAIAAITTVLVLEEIGHVKLKLERMLYGLELATQKGRFEVISKHPCIILDGAHNPDGAKALAETCKSHFGDKKILMVTGILADKDVDSILENFISVTKDFVATEPDNPRKLRALDLKKRIEDLGGNAEAFTDYRQAWEAAMSKADEYDLILFSGSLYLIGVMRTLLRERYLND